MNQMNVKFNIKTFASSIKQIEEHLLCCAVACGSVKRTQNMPVYEVPFLHNANYASLFAMKHEKLLVNDKLQRGLKETCPSEAVIQTFQTTKNDLWKTVPANPNSSNIASAVSFMGSWRPMSHPVHIGFIAKTLVLILIV